MNIAWVVLLVSLSLLINSYALLLIDQDRNLVESGLNL